MVTLRTIDFKGGLKNVSNIIKSGEKVLIVRPHNENFVVMSENEYNELEKVRRNLDNLIKAKTAENLTI